MKIVKFKLIPHSRRQYKLFLWPILGITHCKYGFFPLSSFLMVLITEFSDHFANLITSFSFVKVRIAALGLCAKVIASVPRCNTVSLIRRRLSTMKFRFIKCCDHNKHSLEAIPESEGVFFFQGTSIDRNIGKYP